MAMATEDGRAASFMQGGGPAGPAPLTRKNWSNLVAYVLNLAITYGSLTGIFGETNTDLSKKYQTLVTPAGFAFSIWGPIFIWELVFAVAQMFPRYRGTAVVRAVTPWWCAACVSQIGWTLTFAQEVIPLSLVFMCGILICLLGIAVATDGLKLTWAEYALLRAPFSLHLGWILAATAVNASVQADAAKASPETLLGLSVASYAAVCVAATVFATAAKSPDAIVCLVVAWAFNGIRSELGNPQNLDDPSRHNPYNWDRVTLGGLQKAALGVTIMALALMVIAMVRSALPTRHAREASKSQSTQPGV